MIDLPSRSSIISSRSRELREERKYRRTHSKMISDSRVTPLERTLMAHEGNSSPGLQEGRVYHNAILFATQARCQIDIQRDENRYLREKRDVMSTSKRMKIAICERTSRTRL